MNKVLLIWGLGLFLALGLVAFALAQPQPAGGQQATQTARGWQITEIALSEDMGQIVYLPARFVVLGVALNAQDIPVLSVAHPVGAAFNQEWRGLFLAARPVYDVQLDSWWYVGMTLYHGWLRYLFLQPAPTPTATLVPTTTALPPPTCERGAECPYPTLPPLPTRHPAGVGR